MALNIKNPSVERLVEEISELTGESKTEAVRRALEERKASLALRGLDRRRASSVRRFLEMELWPLIPAGQRGRRLTKEEEEALLGIGPEGA